MSTTSMNPPNINAENLPLEPGYRWVDIANEPWVDGVEIALTPRGPWRVTKGGSYRPAWSYRVKEENPYASVLAEARERVSNATPERRAELEASARAKIDGNPEPDDMLFPGAKVSKTGGDYRFDGTVVGVFRKISGVIRYAVEDDRGVVHIYSRKNLIAK